MFLSLTMAVEDKWCVVTGGRGFAARHLVEMLIRHNEYCVRIADLEASIVLEPAEQLGLLGQALHSGRAQYVSLDLRNKVQVLKGSQQSSSLTLTRHDTLMLFYE